MKSLNLIKSSLVLAAMFVVFTVCVERANSEFVEGHATNLGPAVNTSLFEGNVTVTRDGLELYFASTREGGEGISDIWKSRRAAPNEPWPEPVNLGPTINSADNEFTPAISADGLELYFSSNRDDGGHVLNPWEDPTEPPDFDLYVTKRASRSEPWGPAENLVRINRIEYDEVHPDITSDGLELYYKTDRPHFTDATDTLTANDFFLFKTSRISKDDRWTLPRYIGPTNRGPNQRSESKVYATTEGYFRVFYGEMDSGYGQSDLWQVQIHPVLDFNGDGIVDMKDLSRLTDYWEQEEPSVDIAPGPYGDGIIDFNDMDLLLDYWEQEVNDVSLIAHWDLDEIDGNTACDSSGGYDGTLYGEPLWQPEGGVVGGALEFDGVDDRVVIEQPLTESEFDSFSIIAWIKGGAPGQVIFSQYYKANWLMAGDDGALMMVLHVSTESGRGGAWRSDGWELQSQAIITDGQWHRVSFVWDNNYEEGYGYAILYVDGTEVARDVLGSLDFSEHFMQIGVGKDYQSDQPAELWIGLIDDVRIYKRAVNP